MVIQAINYLTKMVFTYNWAELSSVLETRYGSIQPALLQRPASKINLIICIFQANCKLSYLPDSEKVAEQTVWMRRLVYALRIDF